MPSTYAHYRMGQEVRQQLTGSVREAIEQYPDLYNIGLHGPDLLFYYKALGRNHVNSTGVELHKHSGSFFFKEAGEMIRMKGMNPAHLSHAYGYLCHFALDVTCHGFVNGQIKDTGVKHLALESELDRRFLLMDGKDPVATLVTGHLIPSEETAGVIKDFYPELTTKEVYRSIKDMVFYLNFLVSPGKVKRGFIVNVLKLAGQYDPIGGLLIQRAENPAARGSVDHLLKLYDKGRGLAIRLIKEYEEYLAGKKELDTIYRYNFETVLTEK
ncbi:MAG: zinc dependent phospholipase C family protein [Lachnospiraceae bacterium]|nr:zinc dependent phospholipase C family protein [Lachnospiraceae bacterium]